MYLIVFICKVLVVYKSNSCKKLCKFFYLYSIRYFKKYLNYLNRCSFCKSHRFLQLSLCFLISKCTNLKYELRKKKLCSRKALTTRNIFNLICPREQIFIWYLHKIFKQEVVSSHTKQIHVTRSSFFIMLV